MKTNPSNPHGTLVCAKDAWAGIDLNPQLARELAAGEDITAFFQQADRDLRERVRQKLSLTRTMGMMEALAIV